MHIFHTVLGATAASVGLASTNTTVSYDNGYDDADRSMKSVTCSDGVNGLITKYGWQTQGAVTDFPYIGGFMGVQNWNSSACGTCYNVTYNTNTIRVLVIDHVDTGFNLAKSTMDKLTNGQAEALGRIDAHYTEVDASECGLHTSGGLHHTSHSGRDN